MAGSNFKHNHSWTQIYLKTCGYIGMTDQVIDLKTVFADDDVTDVLEYSVTSNLNENVVIAKITNTTLTLTFSKINAGKSELIITASSNGKSVQSKFSVEVKLPTAIDPVFYTREISIYPNPTKGIVQIKFSDSPPAGTKIVVYDLSGKTISESFATAKEEQLMLTGNPSGIYLIKINKKIPLTFKIVLE